MQSHSTYTNTYTHTEQQISGCNGMWVWQDKQRMSPPQHTYATKWCNAAAHRDVTLRYTHAYIHTYIARIEKYLC